MLHATDAARRSAIPERIHAKPLAPLQFIL